jgi:hypothetical protein
LDDVLIEGGELLDKTFNGLEDVFGGLDDESSLVLVVGNSDVGGSSNIGGVVFTIGTPETVLVGRAAVESTAETDDLGGKVGFPRVGDFNSETSIEQVNSGFLSAEFDLEVPVVSTSPSTEDIVANLDEGVDSLEGVLLLVDVESVDPLHIEFDIGAGNLESGSDGPRSSVVSVSLLDVVGEDGRALVSSAVVLDGSELNVEFVGFISQGNVVTDTVHIVPFVLPVLNVRITGNLTR